jgi:hypothetical protein
VRMISRKAPLWTQEACPNDAARAFANRAMKLSPGGLLSGLGRRFG